MWATLHDIPVEPMLSFDLSVIDIVLVIAIIILLLLHTTRKPAKYTGEPQISRKERKPLEEPRRDIVMPKTPKREKSLTRLPEDSVKCSHYLGYLKTLPKRGSIPEECYNCPLMMQCLFSTE